MRRGEVNLNTDAGRIIDAGIMAEDDLDKILSDQKSLEGRKQKLIDDLLKAKEAAIKDFDEKLAKLGYGAKPKRSHHKNKPSPPDGAAKAKDKPR